MLGKQCKVVDELVLVEMDRNVKQKKRITQWQREVLKIKALSLRAFILTFTSVLLFYFTFHHLLSSHSFLIQCSFILRHSKVF